MNEGHCKLHINANNETYLCAVHKLCDGGWGLLCGHARGVSILGEDPDDL